MARLRRRYHTPTNATKDAVVNQARISHNLGLVNFTAGLALLLMLHPIHGHMQVKPAGVRTAIELVRKKMILDEPLRSAAAGT